MAEPTSSAGTGIVAAAAILIGPMAGEYAVIAFAALAGSLWALQRAPGMTRSAGMWLVVRVLLTALILTGGVALLLDHYYHWPAKHIIAPVAFLIGAYGDRWNTLLDLGWRRALERLAGTRKDQGPTT